MCVREGLFFLLAGFALSIIFRSGVYADDYGAKRIATIKAYGKDLDWSSAKNLIASAKPGADGYYDVFVMRPDGTGEALLTHDKPGCPQKHNGNVAWHPSGGYLVFTAQNPDTTGKAQDRMAIPGTGLNCNLWLMKSDATAFWKLTDYPAAERLGQARGVIHPQFSGDGKKLFWAERVGADNESGYVPGLSRREQIELKREKLKRWMERVDRDPGSQGEQVSGAWGVWALKVADFAIDEVAPRLTNIRTYQPGNQQVFYESHMISFGGSKILFSGNLMHNQPETGLDIYEMDVDSGKLRQLTSSFKDWDEHAHYSPDGAKIAWMSSSGFDIQYDSIAGHSWAKHLKTELWVMDADGSHKRKLTHFNEAGYPEYMGGARCIVSDSAFSPDGKSIVATVAYQSNDGKLRAKIVIIEL